MTEIEAILIKAQNQLEIAEKELSYAQKTQNRIKEKNLSDYQEIVQHTRETLETAMTDIGEINDSIDDFLGITYGSTRPDGIWILDITTLSQTASYIGESEFYREQFYEIYNSQWNNIKSVNIKLWDTGLRSIFYGLKALNNTLYIIQESVEDQISNPVLVLEDEKTKYRDYRDDIIGYMEILRENKSTIQGMDDEEWFALLQEIELKKREAEVNAAKTEVKKAERLFIEIKTNGDADLENL